MMLSFSGNDNRMDGYTYDTAGNLLSDGSHSYTYDAENRLTQVDGGSTATYTYDANGRRIENTGDYTYSPMGVVDYAYDLQGHLFFHAWENPGPSTDCCFYDFYLGNRHVYYSDQKFSHTDWLGTERLRWSTTKASDYCTSLPFGDALSCTNFQNDESSIHFTGQQHDYESNLDNFGARFYSSQAGRFTSADPSSVFLANFTDPQELNLYAYVRNNPLNMVDPTGLDGVGPCIYQHWRGSGLADGDDTIDNESTPSECSENSGIWGGGNADDNKRPTIPPTKITVTADSGCKLTDAFCLQGYQQFQFGLGPHNPPWLPKNVAARQTRPYEPDQPEPLEEFPWTNQPPPKVIPGQWNRAPIGLGTNDVSPNPEYMSPMEKAGWAIMRAMQIVTQGLTKADLILTTNPSCEVQSNIRGAQPCT